MRYKPKGRLQVYKGSMRCPSPVLELSDHAEELSERDPRKGAEVIVGRCGGHIKIPVVR